MHRNHFPLTPAGEGSFWAKQLGYTNIYRAPGGIPAWMDAGYPYKTLIK